MLYLIFILIVAAVTALFYKSVILITNIKHNRTRLLILVGCFLILIFIFYILILKNYSHNYEIALIEPKEQNQKITLYAKVEYGSHDAVSLFKRRYYTDSIQLLVPNHSANTQYNLVQAPGTNFNFSNGFIAIDTQASNLKVNLFYKNAYTNEISPFFWNGSYKLSWNNTHPYP